MIGIKMSELIDLISYGHEAEFSYHGKKYVLQSELIDDKAFLVIWDCSPNGICLCRLEIPEHGDIPTKVIEQLLNEKCFNGKSFMDIEKDVSVDVIF
ncbi:MAG: hypothetical protein HUJ63_06155 [Enterococcus sp.]|nr:hypothetical protein [Enterococcus sp.]